jgi:hypothetical protein
MWVYALFLLLLVVILVSLAIDRRSARKRFTAMSLQDLQRKDSIPKWTLIQEKVGGTQISSEYKVWFEVLLKKTFEESADWEHDYPILLREWAKTLNCVRVNYLKATHLFQFSHLDSVQMNRVYCNKRAKMDDRWFFNSLAESFNWLGQAASTQQRLMTTNQVGFKMCQWNSDMFKWGPLGLRAEEWFETSTSPNDIADEANRILAEIHKTKIQ